MEAKSWIMLRVLLNRYHQGASLETFLKGQPQEFVQNVLLQDVHSEDPSHVFSTPENALKGVHHSWITNAFSHIPEELHPLYLSLLPEQQMVSVAKSLSKKPKIGSVSPQVKHFLLQKLLPSLERDSVIEIEFLPKSVFRPLLDMKKEDLVELVNYLGIYDLASEMRHVVDKKTITNIYTCLSPKKQQFLRACLHQKEKLATPRLLLEKWDGECKILDTTLHNRGLLRLGKALVGQNRDLVWHLVHKFDIGRGKILIKHANDHEVPGVATALTQQVINVMNFLNQKGPS